MIVPRSAKKMLVEMLKAGYTLEDIAERADLSVATLRRILQGKSTLLHTDVTLLRIYLGLEIGLQKEFRIRENSATYRVMGANNVNTLEQSANLNQFTNISQIYQKLPVLL